MTDRIVKKTQNKTVKHPHRLSESHLYQNTPQMKRVFVLIAGNKCARIYESEKCIVGNNSAITRRSHPYGGVQIYKLTAHPQLALTAENILSQPDKCNLSVYQQMKRKYTIGIALTINRICHETPFVRIILAAPPRMISELKDYLLPNAAARVIAEVPKELAHHPEGELATHLEKVLPFAHAA